MNWKAYWKKKHHKRRDLCELQYILDAFELFKYGEGLAWVMASNNRITLQISEYNLVVRLMYDYSLSVMSSGGNYIIPVEKLKPNYGGTYYFFHCPQCDKRMRKLYLLQGKYLCRKCANLDYHCQRLRSSYRCLYGGSKIKETLLKQDGSLDRRPPWKKQHTFQKIRKKYLDYDEKYFYALRKELRELYGSRIDRYIDEYYFPSQFHDLYDYKQDSRPLIFSGHCV